MVRAGATRRLVVFTGAVPSCWWVPSWAHLFEKMIRNQKPETRVILSHSQQPYTSPRHCSERGIGRHDIQGGGAGSPPVVLDRLQTAERPRRGHRRGGGGKGGDEDTVIIFLVRAADGPSTAPDGRGGRRRVRGRGVQRVADTDDASRQITELHDRRTVGHQEGPIDGQNSDARRGRGEGTARRVRGGYRRHMTALDPLTR